MESEIQQTPSYTFIALKWGLINALVSFIFTVVYKYSGSLDQFQESYAWVSSILSLVISVTFLVLAIREFREANKDELKYSTGLGLSTLLGAISGLVSGGFNYIYLSFIDDSSTTKQLNMMIEKYEEQGMSQSQIDQAVKMTKLFIGPGVQFVAIVFMSVVLYFIYGLIVSGIMKKEKSIFE